MRLVKAKLKPNKLLFGERLQELRLDYPPSIVSEEMEVSEFDYGY